MQTTPDLDTLVRELLAADLQAASPAMLRAVGGLAYSLAAQAEDAEEAEGARRVAYAVTDAATKRLAEATEPGECETWLDALLHFTPADFLFCDVVDEDEYQSLCRKQDQAETRWRERIRPLLQTVGQPFAGLPVDDRLRRLHHFFRQDINELSGADDQKAYALLSAAAREFEACRRELFAADRRHLFARHFALYYPVLCAVRPDQASPANRQHYRQFFAALGSCFGRVCVGSQAAAIVSRTADVDSRTAGSCSQTAGVGSRTAGIAEESRWQCREILWHHRQALAAHDDRAALAGLWLARPDSCTAFRRQLYRWHLEDTAADDCPLAEYTRRTSYANEGLHHLTSWFAAKQKAAVQVPAEQQAEVLMAYALARCTGATDDALDRYFCYHAYDVLASLQPSKRKTHLKVHIDSILPDRRLLAEARTEATAWPSAGLTQEDKFLLDSLRRA